MSRKLYDKLKNLTTEARNPRSTELDQLSTLEIVQLINQEDHLIAPAVAKVLPQVARAADLVTASFNAGGRLIYAGAGTSGRLGVLDASECPPTFGVQPRQVQGVIAGGRQTLVRSREGVEDDREAARAAVDKLKLDSADTLVGIAASGRTPYPLAALAQAKKRSAATVFLVCNRIEKLPRYIDLAINPILGPELLTGSTRMKAGTACKLILNMISTAAMVRTGRCFGNLMVDLRATSAKLQERARRILVEVTGISYAAAGKLLEAAHGEVKTALAMQLLAIDYRTARRQLAEADGHLHRLISH